MSCLKILANNAYGTESAAQSHIRGGGDVTLLETQDALRRAPLLNGGSGAPAGRSEVYPLVRDLNRRARAAASIAAAHAGDVDGAARFPEEAMTALRAQR